MRTYVHACMHHQHACWNTLRHIISKSQSPIIVRRVGHTRMRTLYTLWPHHTHTYLNCIPNKPIQPTARPEPSPAQSSVHLLYCYVGWVGMDALLCCSVSLGYVALIRRCCRRSRRRRWLVLSRCATETATWCEMRTTRRIRRYRSIDSSGAGAFYMLRLKALAPNESGTFCWAFHIIDEGIQQLEIVHDYRNCAETQWEFLKRKIMHLFVRLAAK